MFKPISVCIGFRNCFGNTSFFAKFVARSAQVGIVLGVTALIVVMSVMNGFKTEMVQKFLQTTPHIILKNNNGKEINNINMYNSFQFFPIQAAISSKSHFIPIMLAASSFVRPGQVVLPNTMANQIIDNTPVQVFSAKTNMLGMPKVKIQQAKIKNMPEWQSNYAYISLELAQNFGLIDQHNNPNIYIFLKEPMNSEKVAASIIKDNPGWLASTWQAMHAQFFQLIATQKSMMFLVLLFIVMISGFGLISGQVMLVQEKRREIAILTTMGSSYKVLLLSYFIQGLWLGLIGLLVGVLIGYLVADNVTFLVHFIEDVSGQIWLSHALYGMDHMPSKILLSDVVKVFSSGLLLCMLTPIYPAYLACKTEPVTIFRQVEGG